MEKVVNCKRCGDFINLHIFGAPDNICFECLSKDENEKVLNKNIEALKKDVK